MLAPMKSERAILRSVWGHMHDRCYKPKAAGYHRYGALGITVCERWHNFENFCADMGPRPEGKSIDRIDGTKGYSPDNCRWATPLEQTRNRISTIKLTHEGETLHLIEWSERLGIGYQTLLTRVLRGYPVELVLTMPVLKSNGTKMRRRYPMCKRGHLYEEHGKVNNRGRRVCKICEKERNKIAAARRLALLCSSAQNTKEQP